MPDASGAAEVAEAILTSYGNLVLACAKMWQNRTLWVNVHGMSVPLPDPRGIARLQLAASAPSLSAAGDLRSRLRFEVSREELDRVTQHQHDIAALLRSMPFVRVDAE